MTGAAGAHSCGPTEALNLVTSSRSPPARWALASIPMEQTCACSAVAMPVDGSVFTALFHLDRN